VTEAAEGGATVPQGWLEHVFVPLGYEATGAWGPKADYAFCEVAKAYKATRAGNIDKQEFRFGDYWEQAISAAILRGQAAVAGRGPSGRVSFRHLRVASTTRTWARRGCELACLQWFCLCSQRTA
jgi:hypothetical protein